jgi:hypothetical protein
MSGKITKAFLYHSYNGNYLYIFDEKENSIQVFVIKSCVLNNKGNIDLKPNSAPKINNFRMAKKCTLNLEYEPKTMDNYSEYLLISYQEPIPYIDIWEKSGTFY